MSESKIRVLIVDDSAFARKVIREVLSRDEAIDVIGYARDGLEALEKIAELTPDVVTLDLVMPDLDGIAVLKALGQNSQVRVVVVSASGAQTDLALQALEAGAVDVVTKPTTQPTDRLYDLAGDLVYKVKAAALAKLPAVCEPSPRLAPLRAFSLNSGVRVVAIGTSTGGPQALTEIFTSLPADFPVPIVLALHIPPGYTEALAARLTALGGVRVIEAVMGLRLEPGVAMIAPGGLHLKVNAVGNELYAEVTREPETSLYHPSVSLLFESVAKAADSKCIGMILTGMGDDGFTGSQAIKAVGGRILAESESSCIVYGMPRVVIEAGLADAQAPLTSMGELLVRTLGEQGGFI